MKLLALDFDGVISQSDREALAVARRTYLELSPGSTLGARSETQLRPAFLDLMPLGTRAEDFGVALRAIEQDVLLADQTEYDAFRAGQDPAWLRAFHRRFYAVRESFARTDPVGWRRLLAPYEAFVELLRRRAGEVGLVIATAKDRRSVRRLLQDYGLAHLFGEDAVLDKETGVSKVAHLEHSHRHWQVPYPEITFVDDKVNHLDAVASLGVRCVLAAWGYNGPREQAQAVERGYLVCTLEEAESRLFGER